MSETAHFRRPLARGSNPRALPAGGTSGRLCAAEDRHSLRRGRGGARDDERGPGACGEHERLKAAPIGSDLPNPESGANERQRVPLDRQQSSAVAPAPNSSRGPRRCSGRARQRPRATGQAATETPGTDYCCPTALPRSSRSSASLSTDGCRTTTKGARLRPSDVTKRTTYAACGSTTGLCHSDRTWVVTPGELPSSAPSAVCGYLPDDVVAFGGYDERTEEHGRPHRNRRSAAAGERDVGDPHPDEQQRDRGCRDVEQVVGSGATQEVREDQSSHRGQSGDGPEAGTVLSDERWAQPTSAISVTADAAYRRTEGQPGRPGAIGSAPRPPVV